MDRQNAILKLSDLAAQLKALDAGLEFYLLSTFIQDLQWCTLPELTDYEAEKLSISLTMANARIAHAGLHAAERIDVVCSNQIIWPAPKGWDQVD